jgi:hypothetical protein
MPQEFLNQLQNVFNTAISILQVVATFLVAFLVVLWMTLCFWTFRDIQARTRDLVAQIFATLLVFFFNIPGVLLYILVRPKETLVQVYERSLQEEYMLQDLEEREICSTCRVKTQPDYSYCFNCRTRLRRDCHSCGQLIKLKWASCPFCGTPQKSKHRDTVATTAGGLGAPQPQPNRPAQQPASTALVASTAGEQGYLATNQYSPVINVYDPNPANTQNLPPVNSQPYADGGGNGVYQATDTDYPYRPRGNGNGSTSVLQDPSSQITGENEPVKVTRDSEESLAPDLPSGGSDYNQATQKYEAKPHRSSKNDGTGPNSTRPSKK